MAWYADLAECNYFGTFHPSLLRAVGWLEGGKPYAQGNVDTQFLHKLTELLKDAWEPVCFMGIHHCSLSPCTDEMGSANLFIPGERFLFVCPELIFHYIQGHQYAPPMEFCKAVLACPSMNSPAYLDAVEPLWKQARTP